MSQSPERIERARVEGYLARTLGDEKARDAWAEGLHHLGLPRAESYTRSQVVVVLDSLSKAQTLTGVAARFARGCLDREEGVVGTTVRAPPAASVPAGTPSLAPATDRQPAGTHSAPPSAGKRPSASPSSAPPPPSARVNLFALLAPALGEEKAKEALNQYAQPLQMDPSALSHDGADRLLDVMANAAG